MRVSNRLVLVYVLTVMSLIAVGGWFVAGFSTANAQRKAGPKVGKTSDAPVGTTFPATVGPGPIAGTGTGPIPDGGPGCGPLGTALDISFDGSALSGTITNVTVDMDVTHSWVGDVNARLIAPDATEHVLFAGTGSTSAAGCGSSSDLGAVYAFDNSGTDDWWAQANPFPAGTYQTTVAGDQASPPAGDATDMNAAFAAANPTGTWILRVEDGGGGDTGTVNAANLTITTAAPPTPTLLNEIVVNPNGSDSNCEYVEFSGASGGALTGLYFVSMEGDSTSNEGAADFVADLTAGALGTNGLLVIAGNDPAGACDGRDYGAPSGTVVFRTSIFGGSGGLENGTNSWLLINSPTTAIIAGTDYDTDDNGTLEGLPGDATIVDAVAWTDGGGSDINYGGVVLPSTAGGTNDMATRFPDNLDPLSVPAWYHGDMGPDGSAPANSTAYDPNQVSSNFPSNGALTPGEPNVGSAGSTWLDMDGDGTSDYVVARATSTPLRDGGGTPFNRAGSYRERIQMMKNGGEVNNLGPTPIFWYTRNSSDASAVIQEHGIAATDFITPNDFDGDGKADIAVWRTGPAMTAAFYILNSSDSTVTIDVFGQTADDSGVTGDYDGDGKADPAVFRCPTTAGQCTFFFRGSAGGGELTYVPWGFGTPFSQFANPGDFDGDGKHDFNLQGEHPGIPGAGLFTLLRSSDLGVEYTNWGTNTDLIAPGDYDGDGMDDYTVVRNSGGQFTWYSLLSGGGTKAIDWGITNDFLTPGDYDGDGKQDYSIWRPSSGDFITYRSSDNMLEGPHWGSSGDYPPANSQVH